MLILSHSQCNYLHLNMTFVTAWISTVYQYVPLEDWGKFFNPIQHTDMLQLLRSTIQRHKYLCMTMNGLKAY